MPSQEENKKTQYFQFSGFWNDDEGDLIFWGIRKNCRSNGARATSEPLHLSCKWEGPLANAVNRSLKYNSCHSSSMWRSLSTTESFIASWRTRMYHLSSSYPAYLIFLPKRDCGLNLRRISDDIAQVQKLEMLRRTSALRSVSAAAAQSIIKRATENPPSTVPHQSRGMGPTQQDATHRTCSGSQTPFIRNMSVRHCWANVTPMPLLTHPSQLLQIGRGGIAVVWTPPSSQLLSLPTRNLHVIMPSEQLQRNTPNNLELLGQMIAYPLDVWGQRYTHRQSNSWFPTSPPRKYFGARPHTSDRSVWWSAPWTPERRGMALDIRRFSYPYISHIRWPHETCELLLTPRLH